MQPWKAWIMVECFWLLTGPAMEKRRGTKRSGVESLTCRDVPFSGSGARVKMHSVSCVFCLCRVCLVRPSPLPSIRDSC